MVDFQSRDTRRDGTGDEDPGDDEAHDHGEDRGDEQGHDEREHDHDEREHADEHGQDDHEEHGHHEDHGHDDHGHHHHDLDTVGAAVVTVSSSRGLDDDPSGDAIEAAFEADGHEVVTRELVVDEYDRVQAVVDNVVNRGDVDVVVTTGGTGVTPDDVTVEAVRQLLGKRLPGFGELFRRLSYDDIGTRVVATRAVAGVSDGVPVFCLPGSEDAARLGAGEIIVPEAPHLAGLARRADEDGEE